MNPSGKVPLQWKLFKPWLGVAGLVGLGLLPCPECGAPMILHFWPVAVVLAWRNLVKARKEKRASFEEFDDAESTANTVPENYTDMGGNQ
jgi:hypothetical protein